MYSNQISPPPAIVLSCSRHTKKSIYMQDTPPPNAELDEKRTIPPQYYIVQK
jgi:hypothetical protein